MMTDFNFQKLYQWIKYINWILSCLHLIIMYLKIKTRVFQNKFSIVQEKGDIQELHTMFLVLMIYYSQWSHFYKMVKIVLWQEEEKEKCYFGGKSIVYALTFICCRRLKYINSVKILITKVY